MTTEPDDETPTNSEEVPAERQLHCGFIGMAGAPNAGKSTLVNRLIGQKVAIMSRSPQTTRHRVCGILTDASMQAIFVDVPGIIGDPSEFNKTLVEVAQNSLADCDVILHLRDLDMMDSPNEQRTIEVLREIQGRRTRIWQVWNKMDKHKQIPPELIQNQPLDYEQTFYVSGRTGKGLDRLKQELVKVLPLGPLLYPEDDISDRDLRFLCAELVREKVFLFLQQEIPYGVATWTEEWREVPGQPIYMRIIIQTERQAHKAIIVGANGSMLKKIGTAARQDIEELCEQPAFVDLWVQVRERWRKNPMELDRLGLRFKG